MNVFENLTIERSFGLEKIKNNELHSLDKFQKFVLSNIFLSNHAQQHDDGRMSSQDFLIEGFKNGENQQRATIIALSLIANGLIDLNKNTTQALILVPNIEKGRIIQDMIMEYFHKQTFARQEDQDQLANERIVDKGPNENKHFCNPSNGNEENSIVHVCGDGKFIVDAAMMMKRAKIAIGKPNRICSLIKEGYLDSKTIKMIFIDDCDEMLIRDYKDPVLNLFERFFKIENDLQRKNPQVCMFFSGMPKYNQQIQEIACEIMKNPTTLNIRMDQNLQNRAEIGKKLSILKKVNTQQLSDKNFGKLNNFYVPVDKDDDKLSILFGLVEEILRDFEQNCRKSNNLIVITCKSNKEVDFAGKEIQKWRNNTLLEIQNQKNGSNDSQNNVLAPKKKNIIKVFALHKETSRLKRDNILNHFLEKKTKRSSNLVDSSPGIEILVTNLTEFLISDEDHTKSCSANQIDYDSSDKENDVQNRTFQKQSLHLPRIQFLINYEIQESEKLKTIYQQLCRKQYNFQNQNELLCDQNSKFSNQIHFHESIRSCLSKSSTMIVNLPSSTKDYNTLSEIESFFGFRMEIIPKDCVSIN